MEDNRINKNERWNNPEKFTDHIAGSTFNKKVRDLECTSKKKACLKDADIINDVAMQLSISQPKAVSWPMKNDNHGLLIFETEPSCGIYCENVGKEAEIDDEIFKIFYLLSFCPVY